jgi:Tfp pilus assembly protein PilN
MKAVNLLPNDMRRSSRTTAEKAVAPTETGGSGPFVVLGVLAFCVIALAGYVLTTNTVKDRQAQLASVTAEAQAAKQQAAELKEYADFDMLAQSRVQTVRDLAASRFDWEQALRDVSRAIPADVTLSSLNGSVSSQSGGGTALRSAIASPALELKGCTSSQPAVATLMARLRAVDGVTRVTLSKSVKAEATGDATGAAVLCGFGRKPAFELVIFFERSEVPATVEDITVSPQAVAGAGEPAAEGEATTEVPAEGETTPEPTPASTEDGTS